MWSCAESRRWILRGLSPEGSDFDAHVRGCVACQELTGSPVVGQICRQIAGEPAVAKAAHEARSARIEVEEGQPAFGEVSTAPAPGEAWPPPSAEFESLWTAIDQDVQHERGLLARWRALPTATRWGIVVAMAAALALYQALLRRRADFAEYPSLVMGVEVIAFGLLTLGITGELLRPLHRSVRRSWRLLIVVAALALPMAIALSAPAHWAHPASSNGAAGRFWPLALACLLYGGGIAVLFAVVTSLLDRGGLSLWRQSWLTAIAAGLVANFAMHLHCASTDPAHLWAGHVSVTLVILPLIAGGITLKRRWAS